MTARPIGTIKWIRYALEAAGFFLLMGIFKAIGLDAASALGGVIGRHIFSRLPPARTARENLLAAFPEMTEAERNAILAEHLDNIGRVVGEYPHLGKMTVGNRIAVTGAEFGHAAIAEGKGVMFISGHFANWETLHITGEQIGYDGAIVQRSPNNPFVARWIDKQRALLGPAEQIEKGPHGTKRIFTRLRRGKTVFLLVDQKTGQGVPVPFFGRDAMTTHAPAALALRLQAVLLPVWVERTEGAHFRVVIDPPLRFEASGNEDADILALTRAITEKIEEMTRRRPSQWLWIHRRWPSARDKVRRVNKLIKDQSLGGAGDTGGGADAAVDKAGSSRI